MSLRTKAKRLAHRILGLHTYLRKEFNLMRDVSRSVEAAKTRTPTETRTIAVHEAGHAALQIALDLDCKIVSIISVPQFGSGVAGFSIDGGLQPQGLGEHDDASDELQMGARKAFYLRHAMAYYAGAEAVRQLIPTNPNPDAGGSSDLRSASKLIVHHIGGGTESIHLLFSLAKRRCALLVTHYQPEIRALADALEAELVLSGKAARKVFMRSLTGRSGRLLTFKTDPLLHGLAGDEAFRAFLRRMNLPH
jgi:hypothetical protein